MNLEPLRELERKWRDELPYKGSAWEERHDILNDCADDLSRALAQLDDGWRDDAERLSFMETRRVAVFPEYESQWDAELYDEEGEPRASCGGRTPREAIDNMRNAIAAIGPLPSPPAQEQETTR